ncbi:MAG TPA: hypothetical protein VE974_28020 [Thermoanaerobaculia bacterium]|nr:hypothetical protein [Thermoanaerobaculia bacterium]
MKIALVVSLLFVSVSSRAADPVYLDQLMETPLPALQAQFPNLKRDGCYRVADGRYLLIAIDKKDGKPSRIAYTSEVPCKRPIDTTEAIDVRMRKGVELGDSPMAVREKMGQPDASTTPEPALKRLGDVEYFFVCRVSEMCARHTSVFLKNGTVTAMAEWYSE